MPSWAMWLACFALVIARALISAAESALYGTSDLRAQQLAETRGGAGRRVLAQKTDREGAASALRVGMVLSGFFAAAVGALAPPRMIDFAQFGTSSWVSLGAPLLGVFLVGVLASVLDLTMRGLANLSPEVWALRLSSGVWLLMATIAPFARTLRYGLNLLLRPMDVKVRFEPPPPPLEELQKLLAAQAANHEVDQSAPELIRSIFELSDKRVRDVMVPRTEVVAVDVTTPATDILRVLAEENHSRIPVYREDIDHIVGVLHARDLIPLLQHPELILITDVVRPAHYVPWIKPAGDLLRDMQEHRIHMAMVVDEYGGFMGIVTLEDILREIVGDIADEFEPEEKPYEKLADGSTVVDASVEVDRFSQAFGFELPEGEYETLGGYLASLSGTIPDVGDRFTFNGWQFTVQSKEGARLERVKLSKIKPSDRPATPGTPPLKDERLVRFP